MSLNPDAANSLIVKFKSPRKGSCITKELLAELASLLTVTVDPNQVGQDPPCVSKDPNNLSSLDAEGCILTPAPELYTEDQTFDVSTGADLTFDGFVSSGIDATQAMIGMIPRWASDEEGEDVVEGPLLTDLSNKFPSWKYREISANKVVVTVKGATRDAVFTLQLLKIPVAPSTA